jgi:FixJ family two-component response regulator
MDVEPVVFVISGDSKVRRSLSLRLEQLDCEARLYRSPEDFQQGSAPHQAGCILLHVAHAEIDLDWLTTLGPLEDHWPVIGIAADADVETAVLAMKRGAFDFLQQACSDLHLRAAVDEALRWDAVRRKHIARVQSIRRRLAQLAPPLRDVLELLLRGKSNGEIAAELGLSRRSIEDRRAKVMDGMQARTLAALLRQMFLAQGAGPSRSSPPRERSVQPAAHGGELDGIAPRTLPNRSRPPK